MRNLLHCRRGSVAFATVVAMVPLIGVIALGAEAGTWYVTRQQAQAAADAAAFSGGLKLACELAAQTGIACTDAQSVDYRGKQFAAQNAFCNGADNSYPGSRCSTASGVSQTVVIATSSAGGINSVQATVTQVQPAYLSSFLGMKTVTIGATAKAEVDLLSSPCALALSGSVSFQGSPTVNAPNCGIASNSMATNAINFTGNGGINITNAGTISTQGGCAQTGGSQCSQVLLNSSPAPNLLSALDTAIGSLTKTDFFGGKRNGGTIGACIPDPANPLKLIAYGPLSGKTQDLCYNVIGTGSNNQFNSSMNLNGVYFLTGDIVINGSVTISGTATLILMPPKFLSTGDQGATLTVGGNPTIQLTAPTSITATQVPTKLSSVLNLMNHLLIYDPEQPKNGNSSVNITGSSTSFWSGITYVPNSPVTYQGSTLQSSCTEVIAQSLILSGNANFDNSQCSTGGSNQTTKTQIVKLVQ